MKRRFYSIIKKRNSLSGKNYLRHTLVIICGLGLFVSSYSQSPKDYQLITIAFYNVENLFSPVDDPQTRFHQNTLRGEAFYTEAIYRAKIKNLARVISEIGSELTGTAPEIVGLCEVENRQVLEDLINQEPLLRENYGIIHYDSPDGRGIDVAMIYKKSSFIPTFHHPRSLGLSDKNQPQQIRYTRDQLVVSGRLAGEEVHFIVNHWPSRSGGELRTRPYRLQAAHLTKRIVDSLFLINPYAKIVVMGDFNDDPTSTSIQEVLGGRSKKEKLGIQQLYNPMESLYRAGYGTLAWNDRWNLFDQMLVSSEFLSREYAGWQFYRAGIYNPVYLTNSYGRYKGYPYRAYGDGGFTGGYSDHFPVYVWLIKELVNDSR